MRHLISAAEHAALRWAETLTPVAVRPMPRTSRCWREQQIAELSIAIALMNAWHRLGVGLPVAA